MHAATVGIDEFWDLYVLVPWLQAAVFLVFLLAAIRMYQANPGRDERLMGIGFGLLVISSVYQGALYLGMIPMNYYPGYKDDIGTYIFAEDFEVGWWDPFAWWGYWAALFCGWGLAGLGLLRAGRRILREAHLKHFHPLPPNQGHA